MVQSITAAVTKSVLGELQKAGIIAGHRQHDIQSITQRGGPANDAHPDQNEDNELSQTVQLRLLMSTTKGIFHYNSQQHRFRTTASYVICKHNQKTRWYE